MSSLRMGRWCWKLIFFGKHVGEFASTPATGENARVPLCVVYDLEQIKRGRVYFEMPALLRQLGIAMGAG